MVSRLVSAPRALVLVAAALLAGCVSNPSQTPATTPSACPVQACPACPACPGTTVTPPTQAPFSRNLLPATWADLPDWGSDDLKAAWPAFRQSCRGIASKPHGGDWKRVCEASARVDGGNSAAIRQFFEANFRPYALANGDNATQGMITGYYEPLLRGSRSKGKPYLNPLLGVPDDLLTIDLGELYPELKDKRVRGRLVGNKVVPYYTRAEITSREDHFHGRPLFWVDDAVELFFLQVQGSGRIKLPDGSLARVNYADQNGHPYQSIGRLLVERGELKLEEASMQGIQAWARANPAKLPGLLNSNPSYVFFREVANSHDGPIGALGIPLSPERSLAVDPRSVPLGAPVFLATTRPNSSQPLNRLMLAQDTGGAIKGAVRADLFWGFGRDAGEQAGRMKQSGRMWVLLPSELAPK